MRIKIHVTKEDIVKGEYDSGPTDHPLALAIKRNLNIGRSHEVNFDEDDSCISNRSSCGDAFPFEVDNRARKFANNFADLFERDGISTVKDLMKAINKLRPFHFFMTVEESEFEDYEISESLISKFTECAAKKD